MQHSMGEVKIGPPTVAPSAEQISDDNTFYNSTLIELATN